MRQRYAGTFRSTPGFGDFAGNLIPPTPWAIRTPGAGVIDRLYPAPSGRQKWSVLSVSIKGTLSFLNSLGSGNNAYGKMGKILAGFVLDAGDFPAQVYTSYPGFPTDPALVTDLWNPDVDPLPAVMPTAGGLTPAQDAQSLPVSATVVPPVPLNMTSEYQPLIGIWFNPSLYGGTSTAGFLGLQIANLSYMLNYEDGLGGGYGG